MQTRLFFPPMRRTLLAPLAFFIVAAAAFMPRAAPAQVVQTTVASNLNYPLFVTHAGDGSGRLFIVQQGGRIRILDNGTMLGTDFLHVGPVAGGGLGLVANPSFTGDERGLLGFAFHPNYAENGRFFISYTAASGGASHVREFLVSNDDRNVADATSGRSILGPISQPFGNHNGGMIAFGPDGYLYVSLGDGGSGGDPQGHGQNRATLLGSLLRIDVDVPEGNPATYLIPQDNPFVGNSNGWREEIWAWGLRNAWRFSFDRLDGRLFLGDVGQGTREEVDIITPGGNYGWNIMEGSICYPSGGTSCVTSDLLLPIFEYNHNSGDCSISGGYVYRGVANSSWWGSYFFADYCTGRIWKIDEQENRSWAGAVLVDTPYNIVSFGEDEMGELYYVHLAASTGRVVRIDAPIPSSGVLAQ